MFKVCVRCFTFNQSQFIEDALNGFVMQQTDFPFVAAVVDDASTDGEPLVLRDYYYKYCDCDNTAIAYQEETEYGTLLFAQHKENKNCFFAILLLKENHYSQKKSKLPYLTRWTDKAKYIALCEGDDYWTDPLKLQKQVGFLDAHKNYILCCHRYKVYYQNEDKWEADYVKDLFESNPDGFSFTNADNLRTWITKTVTVMYRRECLQDAVLSKYKYRCDEHRNYHLLKSGPGYCFPFVGAVYRRCDTGVFSTITKEQRERRYCLIRSELLNSNLYDVDLRDTLWGKVRQQLYSRFYHRSIVRSAIVCIRSFYLTDGFWRAVREVTKGLGSFIKGFSFFYS